MTASSRGELLKLIEELGDQYSRMRFGQLVCFAAFLARGPAPQAVWDVEDEELMTAIRSHLQPRQE